MFGTSYGWDEPVFGKHACYAKGELLDRTRTQMAEGSDSVGIGNHMRFNRNDMIIISDSLGEELCQVIACPSARVLQLKRDPKQATWHDPMACIFEAIPYEGGKWPLPDLEPSADPFEAKLKLPPKRATATAKTKETKHGRGKQN